MPFNLKREIITFLVLVLIATIGASAATSTPTPTPTPIPSPSGLTDVQLHAVMSIITNFILSDENTNTIPSKHPVITLVGDAQLTLEVNTSYTELGATAMDVEDGNLTSSIVITGSVDMQTPGIQTLTYTVTDSDNNTAAIEREITVVDTTPSTFTSEDNTTVAENQTDAITLQATDVSAITYSISGGDSVDFDVNATTGVVTFKVAPDFETKDVYTFTATATDAYGNESTQEVTVNISDVVENVGLKKTGQTTVYVANDDGDYQKGVTPSYTRDDATQIVTDHITGLEWQDNAEAKSITKNWADAQTYCSSELSLDGGGWRLPTVQELQGIVVDGAYKPSIDTTAFVNYTTSYYYWSSTTNAHYTSYAWLVDFGYGRTGYYYKSDTNRVRCVR